jgi:hypothetical protein
MSDKAASQKARSPQGCDENGPTASLLLNHVDPFDALSLAHGKTSDANSEYS